MMNTVIVFCLGLLVVLCVLQSQGGRLKGLEWCDIESPGYAEGFCDGLCWLFDDCCPNASAQCTVPASLHSDSIPGLHQCEYMKSLDKYISIINRCPENNVANFVKNACESPSKQDGSFWLPPVSIGTCGLVFKNVFCAICNNVWDPSEKHVLHWLSSLHCDERAYKNFIKSFELSEGYLNTLELDATNGCSLTYLPNRDHTSYRSCFPHENTCDDGERCAGPTRYVSVKGRKYRNENCATCNQESKNTVEAHMVEHCRPATYEEWCPPPRLDCPNRPPDPISHPSMTVLLDINNPTKYCSPNAVYLNERCREFFCATGFELSDVNRCVYKSTYPPSTVIGLSGQTSKASDTALSEDKDGVGMSGEKERVGVNKLSFRPRTDIGLPAKTSEAPDAALSEDNDGSGMSGGEERVGLNRLTYRPSTDIGLPAKTSEAPDAALSEDNDGSGMSGGEERIGLNKLTYPPSTDIGVPGQTSEAPDADLSEIEHGSEMSGWNERMNKPIHPPGTYRKGANLEDDIQQSIQPCGFVELDTSEVVVLSNGSIYVETIDRILKDNEHMRLTNESLAVCFDLFNTTKLHNYFDLTLPRHLVRSYLSLTGQILSLVGLLIMCRVYVAFKDLRNLPGKCLLSLAVALIVAQIFFLMISLPEKRTWPCWLVATSVHYFYLAVFFWMNVMWFDIWGTFQFRKLVQSDNTANRRFIYYSTYAWLTPLMIVILAVLFDHDILPLALHFQPRYAEIRCWLNTKWGLLSFFFIPTASLLLMNCLMFLMTVINLCRDSAATKMLSKSQRMSKKRQLLICMKLSVVMGLTWVFGYLANGSKNSAVLWCLFIIFNSLQGCLICIAFICNRRVLHLIRQRISTLTGTAN